MGMVVQAYKEIEQLPENQTEFYQKVISLVITRYIQKHDKGKCIQYETLLFQDLPEVYQNHLLDLSKVAFNYLKSGKIVFTDADLKMYFSQDHSIQGLGLLKSTQHLQIDNMTVCIFHSFLHSSIQEFLAAYYVYTQKVCDQFELLKNTFFNHGYANVWITFASLNKHAFSEFLSYST